MPLYTRSERVKIGDIEHWKANTVEHLIGECRMSKQGVVLTLIESVGIYAIPERQNYIVCDQIGTKMTVNPEAWDMMKEV